MIDAKIGIDPKLRNSKIAINKDANKRRIRKIICFVVQRVLILFIIKNIAIIKLFYYSYKYY